MPRLDDSGGAAAPSVAGADVERRRSRPFLQYDVFTDTPLTGNQLAVFTEAQGLDTVTMQRLAREMNFPESTFVLPVEWAGTDVRMRIFTPASEIPIAGHPTIGSTFALAEIGIIQPGTRRFVFHLNIGPTPVDLSWQGDRLSFAWMTQPNPIFGPVVENRRQVADALSLTPDDLLDGYPVQQVSCGVPFLYVPLRDAAAVDRATSDGAAFRRLAQATGLDLPIFLFALEEAGTAARIPADERTTGSAIADPPLAVYSRMFAPEFGITEDPATGIASGPLGSYLVHYGLVPPEAAKAMVSRQGVAMGRASRIHISITTVDGDQLRQGSRGPVISDVKVGGEAVLVARGEFLI
jgi:trans-2,3-dihydro-3-hydroxyanthranilate isomerase